MFCDMIGGGDLGGVLLVLMWLFFFWNFIPSLFFDPPSNLSLQGTNTAMSPYSAIIPDLVDRAQVSGGGVIDLALSLFLSPLSLSSLSLPLPLPPH